MFNSAFTNTNRSSGAPGGVQQNAAPVGDNRLNQHAVGAYPASATLMNPYHVGFNTGALFPTGLPAADPTRIYGYENLVGLAGTGSLGHDVSGMALSGGSLNQLGRSAMNNFGLDPHALNQLQVSSAGTPASSASFRSPTTPSSNFNMATVQQSAYATSGLPNMGSNLAGWPYPGSHGAGMPNAAYGNAAVNSALFNSLGLAGGNNLQNSLQFSNVGLSQNSSNFDISGQQRHLVAATSTAAVSPYKQNASKSSRDSSSLNYMPPTPALTTDVDQMNLLLAVGQSQRSQHVSRPTASGSSRFSMEHMIGNQQSSAQVMQQQQQHHVERQAPSVPPIGTALPPSSRQVHRSSVTPAPTSKYHVQQQQSQPVSHGSSSGLFGMGKDWSAQDLSRLDSKINYAAMQLQQGQPVAQQSDRQGYSGFNQLNMMHDLVGTVGGSALKVSQSAVMPSSVNVLPSYQLDPASLNMLLDVFEHPSSQHMTSVPSAVDYHSLLDPNTAIQGSQSSLMIGSGPSTITSHAVHHTATSSQSHHAHQHPGMGDLPQNFNLFDEIAGDSDKLILDDAFLGQGDNHNQNQLLHSALEFGPTTSNMTAPPMVDMQTSMSANAVQKLLKSATEQAVTSATNPLQSQVIIAPDSASNVQHVAPKLREKLRNRMETEMQEIDMAFNRHLVAVVAEKNEEYLAQAATTQPPWTAAAPGHVYVPLPTVYTAASTSIAPSGLEVPVPSPVSFDRINSESASTEPTFRSVDQGIQVFIQPSPFGPQVKTEGGSSAGTLATSSTSRIRPKKVPIYRQQKQTSSSISLEKDRDLFATPHKVPSATPAGSLPGSTPKFTAALSDDAGSPGSPYSFSAEEDIAKNTSSGTEPVVKPVEEEVSRKLLEISTLHPELRIPGFKSELQSPQAGRRRIFSNQRHSLASPAPSTSPADKSGIANSAEDESSSHLRHIVPKKRHLGFTSVPTPQTSIDNVVSSVVQTVTGTRPAYAGAHTVKTELVSGDLADNSSQGLPDEEDSTTFGAEFVRSKVIDDDAGGSDGDAAAAAPGCSDDRPQLIIRISKKCLSTPDADGEQVESPVKKKKKKKHKKHKRSRTDRIIDHVIFEATGSKHKRKKKREEVRRSARKRTVRKLGEGWFSKFSFFGIFNFTFSTHMTWQK